MSNVKNIRNFSIIAHIDHGKSTLADRMLEVTKTVEARQMRDQVLDQMDLERERGITIKMQPVRMTYAQDGETYELNLIDTPGHIDFSYEVSRALKAVEGVVLLVDATQGIQAQTLTTLSIAQELGLPLIPVVNKIDLPNARPHEVRAEIAEALTISHEDVLAVSGKTGEGVEALLDTIVTKIPPPDIREDKLRGLIFDVEYSSHQGVIIYVRLFGGQARTGTPLYFLSSKERFTPTEVGIFTPSKNKKTELNAGEIGYIVTGIKKPGAARVGDTVTDTLAIEAIEGFMKPHPVVFASVYPESQDDFDELSSALQKLSLSDSSITFQEESSGALGRGFQLGVLGMLHLEIVIERLKREFDLKLIVTTPSIEYTVVRNDGTREGVYTPHKFPNDGDYKEVLEPWISVEIITPSEFAGAVVPLLYEYEAQVDTQETGAHDRLKIHTKMPLRELMRGFFDNLKSATSGYASLSYTLGDLRPAQVTRLDILVAGDVVPAFSRVVSKRLAEREARETVEKLYRTLPRQQFVIKIQGSALGRIVASRTLSALRKDVTAKLYGGDITRKMKLREKQKKGKKKMASQGTVTIPQDVFMKMMKKE